MIVYLDGSSGQLKDATPKKHGVIGWALVVIEDDSYTELFGCRNVPRHIWSACEPLSFIEAVLFVSSRGVAPEKITFYTDDEVIGRGDYFANGDKISQRRCHERFVTLKNKISEIVAHLPYPKEVKGLIDVYMRGSRFVKLKGHKQLVYNERVDYLSCTVMNDRRHGTTTPIVPYDEWLNGGITKWSNDRSVSHYPPFVASEA